MQRNPDLLTSASLSGFTDAGVGYRGTATSFDAAEHLALSVAGKCALVLREIARKPGTADEIGARLGWNRMSTQPRCSDLRRDGRIKDSGMRRRNSSGRNAIVWTVVGGRHA